MNALQKLNEALEEQFSKETNGVLNKEWGKVFDLVTFLDNKMNLYERIKFCGPLEMSIKESINMGHKDSSDIQHFVTAEYLFVNDKDEVYIKKGSDVIAKYVESNSCIELIFKNGCSCDIMFDNDEDYKKYLKMY